MRQLTMVFVVAKDKYLSRPECIYTCSSSEWLPSFRDIYVPVISLVLLHPSDILKEHDVLPEVLRYMWLIAFLERPNW